MWSFNLIEVWRFMGQFYISLLDFGDFIFSISSLSPTPQITIPNGNNNTFTLASHFCFLGAQSASCSITPQELCKANARADLKPFPEVEHT